MRPSIGPRARAILRDVAQAATFVLFLAAAQVSIYLVARHAGIQKPVADNSIFFLLAEGITAATAVVGYIVVLRLFEHQPSALFIPANPWRIWLLGSAIGAGLFCSVIGILFLAGHCSIERGSSAAMLTLLFVNVFASILEEILFRGIVFRLLERHCGLSVALAISAALFGLMHAGNSGATWVSTLAIALEAGALLGAAYASARTLLFPIGIHFGWNFTEGGVFGANISGFSGSGLLSSHFSGPVWLSGGTFGPEAGLPAILCCSAMSVFLLWRLYKPGITGAGIFL